MNQYNVIHLDISTISNFHKEDLLQEIKTRLYDDFVREGYSDIDYSKDYDVIINDIYHRSGRLFVIIIDEWDCVVRNHADRPIWCMNISCFYIRCLRVKNRRAFLHLDILQGFCQSKR